MITRLRKVTARAHRWVQRNGDPDRGAFAALELVILTPFIIVMLLLVVGFGRVERGRQLVDQAAQAASRAASLTNSPGDAQTAAIKAATQTLRNGGLSCGHLNVTVDTATFYAGGQVTAHLSCAADLSQLAMAGVPGSTTLKADSTSPLETYRPVSLGFRDSERPSAMNSRTGASA